MCVQRQTRSCFYPQERLILQNPPKHDFVVKVLEQVYHNKRLVVKWMKQATSDHKRQYLSIGLGKIYYTPLSLHTP